MTSSDCKKRNARQKINKARDYFNEKSFLLIKYHLRYCSEKLLALEKSLRNLKTSKTKFRFKSVKRPDKDYIPQMLKEKEIGDSLYYCALFNFKFCYNDL